MLLLFFFYSFSGGFSCLTLVYLYLNFFHAVWFFAVKLNVRMHCEFVVSCRLFSCELSQAPVPSFYQNRFYEFFFSCLRWESFDLNTLSQTLHLKQIFAWTDLLCLSRDVLYLYPLSDPSAHLNLPVDKVIFFGTDF